VTKEGNFTDETEHVQKKKKRGEKKKHVPFLRRIEQRKTKSIEWNRK